MKKIFALILFIFNTSLWAQAVPVKIEKIKGKVLYYRAQTMSILTERSELKNDDLVMTKDGSISLIFEDTTISLSPHSLFRVMNIKNKERYQFGEFLMGEYSSVTRKKLVDKESRRPAGKEGFNRRSPSPSSKKTNVTASLPGQRPGLFRT